MAKYKYKEGHSDEPIFLKDSVVTKLFKDKKNKDYFMRIIRSAFKDEDIFKSNDFEFVDVRIGERNTFVHSEADVIVEDDEVILNVEINYQRHRTERTDNKNMSYFCWLILRQLKRGNRKYEEIKPVYQLNLNLYDQFGKGEFLYQSLMMEKKWHLIRTKNLIITDVNLDYLLKLDYDNVKNLSDDSLEKSLYFLVCNDRKKLDELYSGDDMMTRVKGQLYEFFENGDEYLFYDHEELQRQNSYEFGKEDGLALGITQGITQGVEQNRREVIANMFEEHFDLKTIAHCLKMDIAEVQKIIEEFKKEKMEKSE